MDDLLDILGISFFASGGAWCRLNNVPCIPLPSCRSYIGDGRCKYSSEETGDEQDEPDDPNAG